MLNESSCLSNHGCNTSLDVILYYGCNKIEIMTVLQEISNDHTLPLLSLFRTSGQLSTFQFNYAAPWPLVILSTQSMYFTCCSLLNDDT